MTKLIVNGLHYIGSKICLSDKPDFDKELDFMVRAFVVSLIVATAMMTISIDTL